MILVTRVYVRDLPQSRLLVGRRWIHERKYLSRDTKSESEYVSSRSASNIARWRWLLLRRGGREEEAVRRLETPG